MNANRIATCFAALVAFVAWPAAQAQLFRAYVSSTGLDTNPCSLQQPCRLLPAALTVVADGGEIWMLDSANYNTSQVNVTKSVTILATPGAVGSVVATGGGSAMDINGAGIKVSLRNLVVTHLTSSMQGISFSQGTQLGVSDCEITNVQGSGIYANASGAAVAVRNTVIRGPGGSSAGVQAVGNVVVSLDNVHVKGHQVGVYGQGGASIVVTNSVLSGNITGAEALAQGGVTTRLTVAHSTVSGNVEGIRGQTNTAADTVTVTVRDVALTHNTTAAISAYETASSSLTMLIDGNLLAENNVGIAVNAGAPTLYTRNNNTFRFNTPDLSGGSLTNLAAQ
jgi:hypothetical protein